MLLPSTFSKSNIHQFAWGLYSCVNLKELAVLFEEQEPKASSLTHVLPFHHLFKLTKLVNGYFSQDNNLFTRLLLSQPNLESLELHLGKMGVFKSQLSLECLKTLGCPPQFLNTSYNVTRLCLNFENSTDNSEIDVLGRVLHWNLTKNMKSLSIFLRKGQYHFPEIIRVIAVSHIYIQHLKIHQSPYSGTSTNTIKPNEIFLLTM